MRKHVIVNNAIFPEPPLKLCCLLKMEFITGSSGPDTQVIAVGYSVPKTSNAEKAHSLIIKGLMEVSRGGKSTFVYCLATTDDPCSIDKCIGNKLSYSAVP